jgi:hypothetical protein
MTTTTISQAVEALRDTLHKHCKDMAPDEYRAVLEEFQTDIEGHLEALDEEDR